MWQILVGDKFKVISLNCNGIRDKTKRENIFNYAREKNKVGITFLQETHSSAQDMLRWELQWGKKSDIYLNHGQSNARGNAILFSSMDFVVNKYVDDSNGRIQIISIKIADNVKKTLLINLYNENDEPDQVKLIEKL